MVKKHTMYHLERTMYHFERVRYFYSVYDWNIINCDVKQPIHLTSVTIEIGVSWRHFVSSWIILPI